MSTLTERKHDVYLVQSWSVFIIFLHRKATLLFINKPLLLVNENGLFRDLITVVQNKYSLINSRLVPHCTDCSPLKEHFLLLVPATHVLYTGEHALIHASRCSGLLHCFLGCQPAVSSDNVNVLIDF